MSKKRKIRDIDMDDDDIDWEDEDLWDEVSKWMEGITIMRVASVNHWFNGFMTGNDVWKHVLLRELKLQYQAEDGNFKWMDLYEAAMRANMFDHRLSARLRPDGGKGGKSAIVFESQEGILTQLNKPVNDDDQTLLKVSDGYTIEVENMKRGIWIIELNEVHCLRSEHLHNPCDCLFQFTVDVRHIELFLMKGYTDGTWQYEHVGRRVINFADLGSDWRLAIFDRKYIKDDATILDIFPLKDGETSACFLHGIGIEHTIMGDRESIRTEYHTMKAKDSGEVVAIRAYYSQTLHLDDEGVIISLLY